MTHPIMRLAALTCMLLLTARAFSASAETQTIAAAQIASIETGEAPYYVDKQRSALAINAVHEEVRGKFARAEVAYAGGSGRYDITITTLTEIDGECTYRLLINGQLIGTFQNPETEDDFKPVTHTWQAVALAEGDSIQIESNTHSNGKIPENDAFAWARGRWTQLVLAPADDASNRVSGHKSISAKQ